MPSPYDPAFDAAVMAGPIVDNAGHLTVIGQLEYDGPRCSDPDCDTAVDNDGELCEQCGDQPHPFRHLGLPLWPHWCACGRIRSAGLHTDYDPIGQDR